MKTIIVASTRLLGTVRVKLCCGILTVYLRGLALLPHFAQPEQLISSRNNRGTKLRIREGHLREKCVG